jgi:hypothetical protein
LSSSGSWGSRLAATWSSTKPIKGKGEALISAPPTRSCQAASSRRTGSSEVERIVRNNTINTTPAKPTPRAIEEGSDREDSELAGMESDQGGGDMRRGFS